MIRLSMPQNGDRPGFTPASDQDREELAGASALKVLLVEDDYFAAMSIETALQDAGYKIVDVVDTAERAIALCAAEKPDLVVTDIRLCGELDGIDVAKCAAQLGIPYIIASAHSDAKTRARADGFPPADWLVKPFSNRDLVRAVDSELRSKTSH
ncbi:response regulator [Qipengyuania marisflavi]|uniref:Response regulator n=1 Tax=Qipengyuania marisflavi TaxID=2486356 RepID=A0A5S3P9T0_9SPHN|nr:response regulator [Qipengyuania marisflavi]TMM50282.1 response regulator [Qipengyuania marisflavi]